jgi:hypothetical protein
MKATFALSRLTAGWSKLPKKRDADATAFAALLVHARATEPEEKKSEAAELKPHEESPACMLVAALVQPPRAPESPRRAESNGDTSSGKRPARERHVEPPVAVGGEPEIDPELALAPARALDPAFEAREEAAPAPPDVTSASKRESTVTQGACVGPHVAPALPVSVTAPVTAPMTAPMTVPMKVPAPVDSLRSPPRVPSTTLLHASSPASVPPPTPRGSVDASIRREPRARGTEPSPRQAVLARAVEPDGPTRPVEPIGQLAAIGSEAPPKSPMQPREAPIASSESSRDFARARRQEVVAHVANVMTLRRAANAEAEIAGLGRVRVDARGEETVAVHVVAARAETTALLHAHEPAMRAEVQRVAPRASVSVAPALQDEAARATEGGQQRRRRKVRFLL